MNEDKKFFDVSHPKTVGPTPTSKPIIVGHHPTMPDPMIREARGPAGPTRINIDNGKLTAEPENKSSFGDMSSYHETEPSLNPSSTAELSPKPVAMQPQPEPNAFATAENTPPVNTALSSELPVSELPPPSTQTLPPTAKLPENPEPPADGQLHVPAGHVAYHHKPRIWVWILVMLIILASIYVAVDAKSDVLPFHIFSHAKDDTAVQDNSSQTSQTTTNTQTSLPAGFTRYQPTGTPITFAYPESWGKPNTSKDGGFSQRGAGKKADGVHAFLVKFAGNKDVEVAITSSKYLPAARGTLYYDYLQWCVGTSDGMYYEQTLKYSSTGDIDKPTTAACDQGPLSNVTKLNNAIILQEKAKDSSGTIGNVYTANLSDASLPVLRVKDSKKANSTEIKQLLGTIAGAPQQ